MNLEFEQYSEQLKTYLYKLTANRFDAEDLLHDTYIKAHEKIGTFKGNSSLKTWVFSIATNLAKDNQRVKNRWDLDVQDKFKNAAVENPIVAKRIVSTFNSQTELQFEI